MSDTTKGAILHGVVALAGLPISFDLLPQPFAFYLGAVWAAFVAVVAFYDKTAAQA